MRPLQDIIIVSKIEREGKIQLLEGAEQDSEVYKVIKTGPGHYEFGKFMEMPVKVNDKVYIVGKAANFKDGDKKYTFVRARDVIAVV